MTATKLWDRLACFLMGRCWHKVTWKNCYRYRLKHKGRQKKSAGLYTHRVKHKEYYCTRCGKITKKI